MKNIIGQLSKKALEAHMSRQYDISIELNNRIIPHVNGHTLGTIYNNIALAYFGKNDFSKSLEYSLKAIDLNKDSSYKYQLSLCYLSMGEMEKGIEYYKYREYEERPYINEYVLSDLENEVVIILKEQGFGDEIMFGRAFETLSKKCKDVYWQCSKELYRTFQISYPDIKFFYGNAHNDFSKDFFKDKKNFKILYGGDVFRMCYDKPNPILKTFYKNLDYKYDYNIGFVYKANSLSGNAYLRNVDVYKLLALVDEENTAYWNLQKDDVLETPYKNVFNTNGKYEDFYDMSGLMYNMSSIFTVDTAMAHFSISLGKKTFLFFNKDYLDWRWRHLYKEYIESGILTLVEV